MVILLCCNKGLCSRQNRQQTLPEGRTETFNGQEAADLSTPACTLPAVGDPCLEASKQTSLREACQPSTCSIPISRLCLSRKHTHRVCVCAWLPDLGTVSVDAPCRYQAAIGLQHGNLPHALVRQASSAVQKIWTCWLTRELESSVVILLRCRKGRRPRRSLGGVFLQQALPESQIDTFNFNRPEVPDPLACPLSHCPLLVVHASKPQSRLGRLSCRKPKCSSAHVFREEAVSLVCPVDPKLSVRASPC